MTVEIAWDDETRTALRYSITAPWTWDEFWAAYNFGQTLIDEVSHTVDYLLDADTALRSVPPGMLTQLRAIYRKRHPRTGRTAFIASKESSVRTIWFRMALIVYPSGREEFIFAETLEEARKLLAERRAASAS